MTPPPTSLQPTDEGPISVATAQQKSIALVVLLSIVLPGTGEIYLGGPLLRAGILRLVSFALAWLLIVGIIGIFLVPIVWLSSIIDGIRHALRMQKLRRLEGLP